MMSGARNQLHCSHCSCNSQHRKSTVNLTSMNFTNTNLSQDSHTAFGDDGANITTFGDVCRKYDELKNQRMKSKARREALKLCNTTNSWTCHWCVVYNGKSADLELS